MVLRISEILIACRCLRSVAGAFLLFLSLFPGAPPSLAGNISASKGEVKAAYIYNLFHFAQWPNDGRSEWNVCLFPGEPLRPHLDKLEGRSVVARPVNIRLAENPAQWQQCHILIVPAETDAAHKKQLLSLQGQPVLTITDGETPDTPYTIMFFYEEEGHVRMGLHYPRLKASGISISARLLKILKVRNMQGGLKP